MEKYYSIYRPITPGSYPKPENNEVINIKNFDGREYVEEIDGYAWGYIEYESLLSDDDEARYELYSANAPMQDQFVDECEHLLDVIWELDMQSDVSADMPPEQIGRKMEDSGIYNLFPDYKDKQGFNMELMEDGGIVIECPAAGRESLVNRESGFGQFSFGSEGSVAGSLEPQKYTEDLAKIFHASNAREQSKAVSHFNNAVLYNHDRIDVYYLTDNKEEREHGNEIYDNALWVWHSDQDFADMIFGFTGEDKHTPEEEFRCIAYEQIELGGVHNEYYSTSPSATWNVKENINYLSRQHCPIYFHPVRLEYEKDENENVVSRITYIDNFKVKSENNIDPFDDKYCQNELPLISIAVPYASELSKLPHEGDVLTVLCTEPSDLHRAVEEHLSSVNPHAWEQAEQIQQHTGKDETDDFPMNKPEVESEPDGHVAR